MANKEPTNHEILQAINSFADNTEARFEKLESEIFSVKSDVSSMKSDVSSMKSEMSSMREDIDHIQVNMVTKEYLDDKLMDLKSDLVVVMRKEDHKLNALVDILYKKKVLDETDKQHLISLEPFPKSI